MKSPNHIVVISYFRRFAMVQKTVFNLESESLKALEKMSCVAPKTTTTSDRRLLSTWGLGMSKHDGKSK
jgi:hypothetical protein